MAELPFIPKKEVEFDFKARRGLGSGGLVAIAVFVITLIILVFIIFYKQKTNNNIARLVQEIKSQAQEFDPVLINELTSTSKAIEASKKVVIEHKTLSPIFALLEDNTLPQVSFHKFNAKINSVSLEGKAPTYQDVARQILILKKNPLVKEVSFSKLFKSDDKINFSLDITIKPEALSFRP